MIFLQIKRISEGKDNKKQVRMFLRQDAGIYFSTLNEFLDLIVNDEVTVVNILKIYFMENHLEKETFIPLEKKIVL